MEETFERAKECIRFVDEIEESLNKADVPTDRQAPCGLLPASTPERVDILIEQRDELLEALEALTDQTGSLLSELEYQQVSCPLCGEDPGEGEDALCGVVKALGEASSKARAALAKARGKGDAVEANR